MFRKLLVPLAACALLAGCITTAPYGYEGGDRGDYYYGSPSVDYRYDESGYGYGFPGYGYGPPYYGPYRPGISIYGTYGYPGYGYGGYGGYGYGGYGGYAPYGGYGYGYPGYGYPTTRVHHHHLPPPPTPVTGTQPPPQPVDRPDGGPWRPIDEIHRRRSGDGDDDFAGTPGLPTPSRPEPMVVQRPMPTFEPRPAFRNDGDDSRPAMRQPVRIQRESGRDSDDPTP